jgi:single-strand DNA-binding protein
MHDIVTITGLVATTPTHLVTAEGLSITRFRLASGQRRFDRATQSWVDGETNWYGVSAFRHLATNTVNSLLKGQRVIVTGKLKVREWTAGDKKGISVDIDADAIGHDLTWGTSVFTRSAAATVADAENEEALADADAPDTADVTPEQEEAQVPVPF